VPHNAVFSAESGVLWFLL